MGDDQRHPPPPTKRSHIAELTRERRSNTSNRPTKNTTVRSHAHDVSLCAHLFLMFFFPTYLLNFSDALIFSLLHLASILCQLCHHTCMCFYTSCLSSLQLFMISSVALSLLVFPLFQVLRRSQFLLCPQGCACLCSRI